MNYACAAAISPAAPFGAGDTIALSATPDWKSTFSAWSANAPVGLVTIGKNGGSLL